MQDTNEKVAILLVCMGNICRSPTAEGVLSKKALEAGMEKKLLIDSAGTEGYHEGEAPDKRAQETARVRGYDLSTLRARQVKKRDFTDFDYILAMDRDNLASLKRKCPPEHQHKLRLFLSYSNKFPNLEVPDPYYGGTRGFSMVLDMVEDAAAGLLITIRT